MWKMLPQHLRFVLRRRVQKSRGIIRHCPELFIIFVMTINLFGDWGPRTQRTRTIHTHTLLLPHKCLYFSRWNGPVSQNAVIIYMLMNQKKLRYGVIGTGAIGGYYGGKG